MCGLTFDTFVTIGLGVFLFFEKEMGIGVIDDIVVFDTGAFAPIEEAVNGVLTIASFINS